MPRAPWTARRAAATSSPCPTSPAPPPSPRASRRPATASTSPPAPPPQCAAGSYNPGYNREACISCGSGTITSAAGSDSDGDCFVPAGHYMARSADGVTLTGAVCPADTYGRTNATYGLVAFGCDKCPENSGTNLDHGRDERRRRARRCPATAGTTARSSSASTATGPRAAPRPSAPSAARATTPAATGTNASAIEGATRRPTCHIAAGWFPTPPTRRWACPSARAASTSPSSATPTAPPARPAPPPPSSRARRRCTDCDACDPGFGDGDHRPHQPLVQHLRLGRVLARLCQRRRGTARRAPTPTLFDGTMVSRQVGAAARLPRCARACCAAPRPLVPPPPRTGHDPRRLTPAAPSHPPPRRRASPRPRTASASSPPAPGLASFLPYDIIGDATARAGSGSWPDRLGGDNDTTLSDCQDRLQGATPVPVLHVLQLHRPRLARGHWQVLQALGVAAPTSESAGASAIHDGAAARMLYVLFEVKEGQYATYPAAPLRRRRQADRHWPDLRRRQGRLRRSTPRASASRTRRRSASSWRTFRGRQVGGGDHQGQGVGRRPSTRGSRSPATPPAKAAAACFWRAARLNALPRACMGTFPAPSNISNAPSPFCRMPPPPECGGSMRAQHLDPFHDRALRNCARCAARCVCSARRHGARAATERAPPPRARRHGARAATARAPLRPRAPPLRARVHFASWAAGHLGASVILRGFGTARSPPPPPPPRGPSAYRNAPCRLPVPVEESDPFPWCIAYAPRARPRTHKANTHSSRAHPPRAAGCRRGPIPWIISRPLAGAARISIAVCIAC